MPRMLLAENLLNRATSAIDFLLPALADMLRVSVMLFEAPVCTVANVFLQIRLLIL